MKWLIITAITMIAAAHAIHRQLDADPLPKPTILEETLPSIRALKIMALGYQALVADYYWLRALSHFGMDSMHAVKYPNLIAFVRRVLALDPYFVTAYFFAGTALTVKGIDPRPSIEMLEQGVKYRPDDWRIPFLLGFNAYYFTHDYSRGAAALALAAKHPEAPAVAGLLSSRLAAQGNIPELGIAWIDSILETVVDEELRELYRERRRLLELEVALNALNAATTRFHETRGRRPLGLSELVADGLLERIPEEPLGGRFFLGPNGEVRTSNEGRRLRVYDHPEANP